MTWFSARNISISTVPVQSNEIWKLITDPGTLADMTPLIRSIEATGSQWKWALNSIEALGLKVEAVFTERMKFLDQSQITFTHDPPTGSRERAGVEGVYDLTSSGRKATGLRVDLTLLVDLPLPSLSRRAVEPILLSTMRATGQRFAANLYERLGLDPTTVAVVELPHP
jgi:carbon monoxide dehydrogenase subunit G